MAKVKFGVLGDYQLLSMAYGDDFDLAAHSSKAATFNDHDTHSHIMLKGSGFQFSGDRVTSGHVDAVTFTNAQNKPLVTVTGADFDAGIVWKTIDTRGVEAGLTKIFAGKDTFTGSSHGDYIFGYGGADRLSGGAGDDALLGGTGNDRLTGGAGSDVFLFSVTGGHDIVTDFDADGGGKKQDYINLQSATNYKISQAGHDTIIDLGHGDTLRLLGVDHTHITKADFDIV